MIHIVLLAWAAFLLFIGPARADIPDAGRADSSTRLQASASVQQKAAQNIPQNIPATESPLTPELVCAVQKSLRSGPAWPARKCTRIAAAFNATGKPVTLAAIAANESDWRYHVTAWHGPDVVDAGLMGIRCILGPGKTLTAQGSRPWSAGAPVSETAVPARRCQNGPARGFSVAQLLDPVTSIRIGAAILATKASLGHYNGGGKHRHAYATNVGALAAAFGGIEAPVKGKRVRELVRRIAAAVRLERRS